MIVPAVFKSVTRYAVVERIAAYERLGFVEYKIVKGKNRTVYKTKFKDMPKQLCSSADFREKICGKGGKLPSLVSVNNRSYGIPQGSPISDMLANVYLLDYDIALKKYADDFKGVYYRYSDDIILIIPGGTVEALAARDFAMAEISKHGKELIIKEKKTSVHVYTSSGSEQTFTRIAGHGKNGIEYLGFRYDGKQVRIRDATISGFYRKISFASKAAAHSHVRRYPGLDLISLVQRFNFSGFMQTYGRVDDFAAESDYRDWTFWTYVRRALDAYGPWGITIPLQLRNYKRFVRSKIIQEISAAKSA